MSGKKKRVFACFDVVTDSKQLDFITNWSKKPDSPFIIVDYSIKWTPPESEWRLKLRKRLQFVDLVIILLSEKTYKSHNVLEEVEIANSLGKPVYQTFGTKFGNYKPVPNADRPVPWDWEKLKSIMNR